MGFQGAEGDRKERMDDQTYPQSSHVSQAYWKLCEVVIVEIELLHFVESGELWRKLVEMVSIELELFERDEQANLFR